MLCLSPARNPIRGWVKIFVIICDLEPSLVLPKLGPFLEQSDLTLKRGGRKGGKDGANQCPATWQSGHWIQARLWCSFEGQAMAHLAFLKLLLIVAALIFSCQSSLTRRTTLLNQLCSTLLFQLIYYQVATSLFNRTKQSLIHDLVIVITYMCFLRLVHGDRA